MPEMLPGANADVDALRRFASIKLIVADLDGTLVPSELAFTAQRLLRQLHHSGVYLTIATGRTFCGVRDLLVRLRDGGGRSLIRRSMPVVLYNGSVIVEAATCRLLKRKTIPTDAVNLVIRKCLEFDNTELYAYFCEDSILNERGLKERVVAWRSRSARGPQAAFEFNGLAVEWDEDLRLSVNLEPCALVVKSEPAILPLIAAEIAATGVVSATKSGLSHLELRPTGSNKGDALDWVARRLGLCAKDVLAIGDSDNDVEMLRWAGIGVAVNTASKSAWENANFVCDYGPFQGVVQILRLVHESRRYFRSAHSKA